MAFSQVVKCRVGDHDVTIRHAKYRDEDDMTLMPDFFSRDFSVGTTTGFIRVWEGSYVMLKYVQENDEERFGISRGANCIELGSGTGLFGIALAALGGHVLLSDVKSSVECITRHNIKLNASSSTTTTTTTTTTVGDDLSGGVGITNEDTSGHSNSLAGGDFFVKGVETYNVGKGRAAAIPIDWSSPEHINPSVIESLSSCDHIFACDCIWLPEFAELCAGVCAQLLAHCRKGTRAKLSYPHRAGDDDKTYTNPSDIDTIFNSKGLRVKWILRHPADLTNTFESFDISLIEVFLPN